MHLSKQQLRSLPFWAVHAAAIGVFFVHFSWSLVALCVGLYLLRMFAITAGYHRYFSHKSYKLARAPQFLMALLGTLAVQKGPLWWAAHHRHHHRYSDLVEDIHSPLQSGFWWSHVGWILSSDYDETRWDQIPDLAKFPELRFLNQWHLLPGIAMGLALFALGGLPAFFWGFCLSTVLLWHGTFTINSLSHVFGTRRYETTDTSRNNPLLAIITLGEGWHNNHHMYMVSARQGFYWWELDMSYYALKALSWIGIARDLKQPPLAQLEKKRIKPRRSAPRSRTTTSLPEAVRPAAVNS
jgi:stearoyl-CoA desaturase (delta-9 desaturase)